MKIDRKLPVIFMRIAWMKDYKGITKDDIPMGAGSFVDTYSKGGEVYNFKSIKNITYGYVRVSKGGNINIRNLGAGKHDTELNGVNIVFFSKDPDSGGQYIVGFYSKATLFKNMQFRNSGKIDYTAFSNTKNTKLIPIDLRSKEILGPGHSNIFYAAKYLTTKELNSIYDFIENPVPFAKTNNDNVKRAWLQDAELRKRIEMAAMEYTIDYYSEKGYKIKDVHRENKGWDIEATRGSTTLHIEIKGTQHQYNSIELTPNEYKKFISHKKSYKLCVVSNVLNKTKIKLDLIFHSGKSWKTNLNKFIKIVEIKSANISIVD